MKVFLTGFSLLGFLAWMPYEVAAQEIDAKIKKLEEIEARIDAKIKKLEEMEARVEMRLQQVSAPTAVPVAGGVIAKGDNGARGLPLGMPSASIAGAVAASGNGLLGGQVSFRGGYTHLDKAEQAPLFSGSGTGQDGWMVGGALDVPLMKEPFFNNTLLGQISMDFSGINGRTTRLLGAGDAGRQSLYKIAVSPKYRIDTLGDIRPWIIPIGLSFLVNSPPSESTAYLTVGGTTGVGIEYVLAKRFSLGVAFSYNFYASSLNRANTNHLSVGPYVGINF
jgi:hypothetical protein